MDLEGFFKPLEVRKANVRWLVGDAFAPFLNTIRYK